MTSVERITNDRITVEGLTGDAAIAHAMKQCDIDVVAAYPITPQMYRIL
jgi:pyruvate/2-oxoacid:ferredoxin oxidoreductase alpha subunit